MCFDDVQATICGKSTTLKHCVSQFPRIGTLPMHYLDMKDLLQN